MNLIMYIINNKCLKKNIYIYIIIKNLSDRNHSKLIISINNDLQ